MSGMRKIAVLAVVALGLVALAAPAAAPASSKSIQRLNKDVDRLGKNVDQLRKKTDEMNNTIASLASTAGSALTQLQSGLVKLADTTANFKYGVVQVGTTSTGLSGAGPTHFFATPPIYKTGEQSTVTFSVPATAALGLGSALTLKSAVRSVNPDSGSVKCKMTAQKNDGVATSAWGTWRQGTTDGIFVDMPQSRISPQNGNTSFPYALVPTEDNVLDLADERYSANLASIAGYAAGGAAPTQQRPATTGGLVVTLSCLVS